MQDVLRRGCLLDVCLKIWMCCGCKRIHKEVTYTQVRAIVQSAQVQTPEDDAYSSQDVRSHHGYRMEAQDTNVGHQ